MEHRAGAGAGHGCVFPAQQLVHVGFVALGPIEGQAPHEALRALHHLEVGGDLVEVTEDQLVAGPVTEAHVRRVEAELAPANRVGGVEARGDAIDANRGLLLLLPARDQPLDVPEQRVTFGALGGEDSPALRGQLVGLARVVP
jgi:hypothetical protein